MNKRLLTVLCMIILIAVAMTAVVAVASASVDTLDYIYKGEYAHGIAGYSNDSVIVFGQANEIADEEYGIAIKEGESYKYFKADSVGTTGKFGIAFPAESIPDGEYKAYAYLKASNGDYVLGNEVDLVLNAGGDYTVNVVITDGVASWTAPAGTYSTVVKLNGVEQAVGGTSFDLSESQNYVAGTNLVEVECLTKSGYTYTGSATMNIVEINAENFADIENYSRNDYLVLTQDIDVTDYFTNQIDGDNAVVAATGGLKATFDGAGHTISYDVERASTDRFVGVFAYIEDGAVLKNTAFDFNVIETSATSEYTHAIAGRTYGDVVDVYAIGTMDTGLHYGSLFGSPRNIDSTINATFTRVVANITELGGAIPGSTCAGICATGNHNNASTNTTVTFTDCAVISANSPRFAHVLGTRDNCFVATSTEDFVNGNGWIPVIGGYGNGASVGSGNTAVTAWSGVDNSWLNEGVWSISNQVQGDMLTTEYNFGDIVIASKTQAVSMSINAGKLAWSDIGADKYEIVGKIGEGAETPLGTVNTNSYDLKQAIAGQSGLATVKVIAKDVNDNEILTITDSINLVGDVTAFKAMDASTDYMQTADLSFTTSDFTTSVTVGHPDGSVSANTIISLYNATYDGAGYKISYTYDDTTSNNAVGGLFGLLETESTIKNIWVDANINANKLCFVVSGTTKGNVTDCVVDSTLASKQFNGHVLFGVVGSTYYGFAAQFNRVVGRMNYVASATVSAGGYVSCGFGSSVNRDSTSVIFNNCVLIDNESIDNSYNKQRFAETSGTKTNCFFAKTTNDLLDGNGYNVLTGQAYYNSAKGYGEENKVTGQKLYTLSTAWTTGAWNVTDNAMTFFGRTIFSK